MEMVYDTIHVAIVGASGYSGAELLRLLLGHPHVVVDRVFANTSSGERVDRLYPNLRGRTDLVYEPFSAERAAESDLVFLAMPSGEAMAVAPLLLGLGSRVIDLGGDFRLKDPRLYHTFYGREHTCANLLADAVYGLPEWNREAISTAQLVANPGCYPTSAILPLAPLLRDGLVAPSGISVCSMSGTTGAGRSSSVDHSFTEIFGNVKAYRVGNHQHIPEMRTVLESISGETHSLSFIPHLIPVARGIYTSTCAQLKHPMDESDVEEAFAKYYADEPFVRFVSSVPPEIRGVVSTNFIDIGYQLDIPNNQIILLSAIDNLLKGAAGQGVQNMNIMFGFPETEGLL